MSAIKKNKNILKTPTQQSSFFPLSPNSNVNFRALLIYFIDNNADNDEKVSARLLLPIDRDIRAPAPLPPFFVSSFASYLHHPTSTNG